MIPDYLLEKMEPVLKWDTESNSKVLNIHYIDETLVLECIKKQRHRNLDESGKELPDHYQNVHILETTKGFFLVYGCERRGTGSFKTLEEASGWFLNQGR